MTSIIKKEEAPHISTHKQMMGRSIFAVETIAEGIKVQTAFLTDDGKILALPAVFPNQEYALTQLDELGSLVMRHFSEATSIGVKAVAANAIQLKPGSEDTIQ